MVKFLGVVMSVREFPLCWWWLRRINWIDKLIVRYYPHHIAHQIAQEFFMEHSEYSHFLFLNEDTFTTPCHVKLIEEDVREYDLPVIGGYSNYDFRHHSVNFNFRDLRGLRIYTAEQYRLRNIDEIARREFIGEDVEWFNSYIVKVFYQGLTLTAIKREVLEKVPIRPYKFVVDNILGVMMRRGIMHDLQFAIDLKNAGIPWYVDLRAFVPHLPCSRGFIDLRGKRPYVKLIRADGSIETIREDEPYSGRPSSSEDFRKSFIGEIDRREFRKRFIGV